jgi:hypothetical protein
MVLSAPAAQQAQKTERTEERGGRFGNGQGSLNPDLA